MSGFEWFLDAFDFEPADLIPDIETMWLLADSPPVALAVDELSNDSAQVGTGLFSQVPLAGNRYYVNSPEYWVVDHYDDEGRPVMRPEG